MIPLRLKSIRYTQPTLTTPERPVTPMARLIPDDVAERNQGPWPDTERTTLNKLAVALSAEYTVFHGIHWARIDQANPVYGEIDFIVMNRHGRLLAIEQKDAPVTVVRNELMVHNYNDTKPKSVLTQVSPT
jgi:hypothetical protein